MTTTSIAAAMQRGGGEATSTGLDTECRSRHCPEQTLLGNNHGHARGCTNTERKAIAKFTSKS